jgi:hypothetical protein
VTRNNERLRDLREAGDDLIGIPSLKYSCFGSSLMLANGRTAMEGFSGKGYCGMQQPGGCLSKLSS